VLGANGFFPAPVRVLFLVAAVGFGVFGYRSAVKVRARIGRSPWHVPPIVWGLVHFFSLILGVALLTLATPDRHAEESPRPGPGWSWDPTRRHEDRFWDGHRWTHQVRDGGAESIDPGGLPQSIPSRTRTDSEAKTRPR
jgi:hypothetical protein